MEQNVYKHSEAPQYQNIIELLFPFTLTCDIHFIRIFAIELFQGIFFKATYFIKPRPIENRNLVRDKQSVSGI